MKVILVSSPLEHPSFPQFLCELFDAHPDTTVILLSGIINILPLPPLPSSLIDTSILADVFPATALTQALLPTSPPSEILQFSRACFLPLGTHYATVRALIYERYNKVFSELESKLHDHFQNHKPTIKNEKGDDEVIPDPQVVFVPGVQDHPALSYISSRDLPHFYQLDNEVLQVKDIKIASISSGVVSKTSSPPNHPSQSQSSASTPTPVFANEVTGKEFERRLRLLHGADVLVTNVTPENSVELREYIRKSPVKIVICPGNNPEIYDLYTKTIIKVSPFVLEGSASKVHVYKIELIQNKMNSLEMPLDFVAISLPQNSAANQCAKKIDNNSPSEGESTTNHNNSNNNNSPSGENHNDNKSNNSNNNSPGAEEKIKEKEVKVELVATQLLKSKKMMRQSTVFTSSSWSTNSTPRTSTNNNTTSVAKTEKDSDYEPTKRTNGLEWFISEDILELYDEAKRKEKEEKEKHTMKSNGLNHSPTGSDGSGGSSGANPPLSPRDGMQGWIKASSHPRRDTQSNKGTFLMSSQKTNL